MQLGTRKFAIICIVVTCSTFFALEENKPSPELPSPNLPEPLLFEPMTTEMSQPSNEIQTTKEIQTSELQNQNDAIPISDVPDLPSIPETIESEQLHSLQTETCESNSFPWSMEASVRYTTPRGVGYNPGYTTLQGFFASPSWFAPWIPFLDVRAHIFDNGHVAANAGVGMRYLNLSRLWGSSIYYDYRNTKRKQYNQISIGLESLGTVWDFRLNGYLPVGSKRSPFFHTQFYGFTGNNLLIQRSRDFAFKGANAEAGIHFNRFQKMPLYFASGPYYLTGDKTTWGGQLRATVSFFDGILRMEGSTSYDHIFKWIGQGRLSIQWSFGKRAKFNPEKGVPCSEAVILANRAVQPVNRNEIIPIDRDHVLSPAINPVTGLPWIFWFVNNTSHSLGTFESPFSNLVQAQNASGPNQAIYVFPGDGSTTGMDVGITLQNGQMFLGASLTQPIPTTLGIIPVPPFASTVPNITNTGGDVVRLASDNTVSGFSFEVAANTNGISGTDISNLIATQNTLNLMTDSQAFFIQNSLGSINISNNVCQGAGFAGVRIALGTFANLTIQDNYFSDMSYAIYPTAIVQTFNIAGNSFYNIDQNVLNYGASTETLIFSNNYINNITQRGFSITDGSITTLNSSKNTFKNFLNAPPIVIAAPVTNLISKNDTFVNIENFSINNRSEIKNLIVSGDVFDNIKNSSCIHNSAGTGSVINSLHITNTTFSNLTNAKAVHNDGGEIDSGTISGCSFNNFDSTSQSIVLNPTISTPWIITNNTFHPSNPTTAGYATTINLADINVCLEFTGNIAPPSGVSAYQFNANSTGVLNLTAGSDSSTNAGGIGTSGNVNPAGSCSLP